MDLAPAVQLEAPARSAQAGGLCDPAQEAIPALVKLERLMTERGKQKMVVIDTDSEFTDNAMLTRSGPRRVATTCTGQALPEYLHRELQPPVANR